MMRPTLVFAALAALVTAQNFSIDPDEVSLSTRASWCTAETNNCQTLCGSTSALNNTCDDTTLDYSCICANGSAPGLEYYKDTMPYYICEQAQSDCIDENENNADGQMNCTTSIGDKCGTLDPANYTAAASSSTASATSQATASTSGSSASATATSTTASKAAAATNMAIIGNGVAVAAVGLFAVLL